MMPLRMLPWEARVLASLTVSLHCHCFGFGNGAHSM